jgi:hypothetical protein
VEVPPKPKVAKVRSGTVLSCHLNTKTQTTLAHSGVAFGGADPEFLVLAGYYHRFVNVPNFARVAGPLHTLTRQEVPFHWTRECQQSFDRLKQLLSEPPVLAYPDFDRPFTLHTDASGKGLGEVLEQDGEEGRNHPVAYASRTFKY